MSGELAVRDEQLLKIAMQAWPNGFSSPLEMGVEDGIVWAITRGPLVGINGYVLIPPEGHPWSHEIPSKTVKYDHDDDGYEYRQYATEELEVHGGITYGTYGPGGGWIGFDTAHSGDCWPPEFDPHGMSDRYGTVPWSKQWTTQRVIDEAKSLARQIAAIKAEETAELDADQVDRSQP